MPGPVDNLKKNQEFDAAAREFLERVNKSSLSLDIIKSCNKVMKCYLFINNNLEVFKWQVDNRDDPSIYPNVKDFKNRAFRDNHFTAYHVQYFVNSEEALQSVSGMFTQLINLITKQLTPESQLLFASKFQYDKKVGCLEARISRALMWAAEQQDTLPQLDSIMETCVREQGNESIVNVAENYCKKNKITEFWWNGRIFMASRETFKNYAEEILGEDEEKEFEENKQTQIELHNKFIEYLYAASDLNLEDNLNPSLTIYFDKQKGNEFVKWFNDNFPVEDKLTLKSGFLAYYVSVTADVYQSITGKDFSKFLTKKEISNYANRISSCIHKNGEPDYKKIIEILSLPVFEEDYNYAKVLDNGCLFRNKLFSNTEEFLTFVPLIRTSYLSPIRINEFMDSAIRILTSERLLRFLMRAASETLSQTIHQYKNLEDQTLGVTYLHLIAIKLNSKDLSELILHINVEVLSELLTFTAYKTPRVLYKMFDRSYDTLLSIAASKHDGDALKALVNRVSVEALVEASQIKDPKGRTGFTIAVCKQSLDSFKVLADRMPSADLNIACRFLDDDMIKIAREEHVDNLLYLFEITDYSTFEYLLRKFHDIQQPELSKLLVNAEERKRNFVYQMFGKEVIVSIVTREWLSGMILSEKMRADLKVNFQAPFNEYSGDEKEFLSWLQTPESSYATDYASIGKLTIHIRHRQTLMLEDVLLNAELRESFWMNGLKSGVDCHLLLSFREVLIKQLYKDNFPSATIHLLFMIDQLQQADLMRQGANMNYKEFLAIPFVEKQFDAFVEIYRNLRTGNALLKIIAPENYADFIKQLKDYSYRPVLRQALDEEAMTHKFLHTKNIIVPYVSHKLSKNNKKNKVYTATKKQSVRLLSSALVTPVFGAHDKARILVGHIFSQELCLTPKAQFTNDRGTCLRRWVGTKDDVESYAQKFNEVSLPTLDELRERLIQDPKLSNEVLARITRESCMVTVIASSNAKSLEEAKKRNVILKESLNMSIPIVIYDSNNRRLSMYSEIPLIFLAQARDLTLNIRASLKNQINLLASSLFSKESKVTVSKLGEDLKIISQIVVDTEKQEADKPEVWMETKEDVMKIFEGSRKYSVAGVDASVKSEAVVGLKKK